jgi:DNA-binding NarL/FixJ family response regulator
MARGGEHRGGLTRILIVAEQAFARLGLRTLLAERDDFTVVGEASSLEEASPRLSELAPDVILAGDVPDELVPGSGGVGSDAIPLVLLGGDPTPVELARLLQGRVRGILSADATADEIAAALAAVSQGMLVIEPRLGLALAAILPAGEVQTLSPIEEQLTEREHQVLQLVALGLPNKTIATRLNISEHTVKFHVGSILAKLEAGSRTEAVTRAARRGLLTL